MIGIRKEFRLYLVFMILGLLCPVVVFWYFMADLSCENMLISEIILGCVSTLVAFGAMREKVSGRTRIVHWLPFVYLLPWMALLPVRMIVGRGIEFFLQTRLAAYVTMEAFAMAQVIIAVLMVSRLSVRRTGEA